MTGTFVDWHAHWVPPELVELLAGRSAPPCLRESAGAPWFDPGDGRQMPLRPEPLDIDHRRRTLDAAGIDRQVVSLAVVLGAFPADLPADIEDDLVEATNTGFARLIAARGERFAALAHLPVHRPERAAQVLERAMTRQGLAGALLPAAGLADARTFARYDGLLEVAEDLGAHLFIHPAPLPGGPPPPPEGDPLALLRRRAAGFQDSLTQAALTVAYSGRFDPLRRARVHVANLGGSLPLLAERIAASAGRMGLPPGWAEGGNRRFVVDTASFGPEGIGLAARVLGADRLLFGTDHPALPLGPARAALDAAPISPDARAAILSGQAGR